MNISKFKQWTGEKIGLSDKTKLADEFVALQDITDAKKASVEGLDSAVVLFIAQTEKKKNSTEGSKSKLTPLENLGASMTTFGSALPDRSLYGQSLIKMGEVQEKIAQSLDTFISDIKDPFARNMNELKRQLDEYHYLKKKLKSRRLDSDAKAAKVRGLKKDRPDLEQEATAALTKYEDTYDDIINRMLQLEDDEDMYLEDLAGFHRAELAYHRQAVVALESVSEWLDSSVQMKRRSARERFNVTVPVRQRDEDHPASDFGSMSSRRGSVYRQPGLERQDSRRSEAPSSQPDHDHDDDLYGYAHGRDPGADDDLRLAGSRAPARGTTTSAWRDPFAAPAIEDQPQRPPPVAPPTRTYRRALYEFDSGAPDELTLVEGDYIAVVEELPEEGWWQGEVTDPHTRAVQRGLFPVNYTEPCEPPVLEEEQAPPLPTRAVPRPPAARRAPSPSPSPSPPRYESPAAPRYDPPAHVSPAPAPSRPATTTVPRPAILAAGHRAPPPPPTATAHVPPVVRATRVAPPPAVASAVAACATCGCDDYSPNVFKKGSCNNCFHKH
ncbi:hypothetical protein IWQ60_006909 [Tieghemiomyces parasiticus]|uniref:BAR-domain-containing protein n=1 Tax=Tieghemiomyces parasiticus TaxID=78921 RepID=A0A9W8DVX0_9FUNG|nr:hypothetical protein IWQ60_006909 [Tieghemiomyces parasiticus]